MSSHTIITNLPIPPSTNALYRNVKTIGRVKTSAYKSWLTEAGWALKLQRPVRVPGCVSISITVERTNSRRDLDNAAKSAIDLMVAYSVIDDDCHVMAINLAWSVDPGMTVVIASVPAVPVSKPAKRKITRGEMVP